MHGGARHALAMVLLLAAVQDAAAQPCGAGELLLPGTTTCLHLGVVLRAEAKAGNGGSSIVPAVRESGRRRAGAALRAGARVDVDARMPTAAGPLRAYVSVGTDGLGRR
jgi:hypothetical protein